MPKIYELANDLGVKALELVEQLKGLGYDVKSHMSSLSDEEVTAAVAKLKENTAESKGAKKTTKKKVSKKKVTKKKTTKVAASKETKADKTQEDKKATKKATTVRRKTVVRKKASSKKDDISLDGSAEKMQEQVLTKDISGSKDGDEKSKEYLEDRQFSFTPIYTPPEEEQQNRQKPQKEEKEVDPNDAIIDEDGAKTNKNAKKRLGGLASMIAKPKTSKARDIVQLRAEEEAKTYGVGKSSSQVIYKPAAKKKSYVGPVKKTNITEVKDSKRVVQVHNGCTVNELANYLKVKFDNLADKVLDMNLLVNADDYIGLKLANEIAALYSYKVEDVSFKEDNVIDKKQLTEDEKSKLPLRDPIITVMGHVDHGKTTLVDFIRNTKVVDGEAGGITQHIGAYSVLTKNKKKLTFLDTPGHAAFGAMRQRGANVTDIVVLVVAADDGVMPQTKESIRFCQQAEVPVIVAINKMDKEGANPDRVKQGLSDLNIISEDWGGDTQMVPVSALKGEGIDDLLEAIALQSEILELRADPKATLEGVVIESKIEQGRGPVCTILVQSGTMNKGDYLVVGETNGRARSLMDHTGKLLKNAGPSIPVQVLGLNEAPTPGDLVNVVKNEREARKIVDHRIEQRKETENVGIAKVASLEDFFSDQEDEGHKSLSLIVRSDVQGSYEAIKNSLESLGNEEVSVKVIGGGVGAISDSDVQLASSSNGYIIGFNMRPITSARRLAENLGVDIKNYSIIYELINDIKLALEGMLTPENIEKYIGRAEVRDTFVIPKIGTIAGTAVIDGKIERGCHIRLLRDGKILYDGKLSSLKRFKDDVKEVKNGFECGMSLENYNDVKVSDIIEAYTLEEKKRTLEVSEAHL